MAFAVLCLPLDLNLDVQLFQTFASSTFDRLGVHQSAGLFQLLEVMPLMTCNCFSGCATMAPMATAYWRRLNSFPDARYEQAFLMTLPLAKVDGFDLHPDARLPLQSEPALQARYSRSPGPGHHLKSK